MEIPWGSSVHPFMTNILARIFSLSSQNCRRKLVWCAGTQQPIRVLLYVTRTVARWRHRLYMQSWRLQVPRLYIPACYPAISLRSFCVFLCGTSISVEVQPIGVKFCTIVDMDPGQVFFPLRVPERCPKIPNFHREFLENGKSQRYMSNGA